MRVVLFFLVFVLASSTVCNKDRVVSCMLTLADTNHDSKLDAHEIDHFFATNKCATQQHLRADSRLGEEIFRLSTRMKIDGNLIITLCDMNGDKVLSALDYDEKHGCGQHTELRQEICRRCDKCL